MLLLLWKKICNKTNIFEIIFFGNLLMEMFICIRLCVSRNKRLGLFGVHYYRTHSYMWRLAFYLYMENTWIPHRFTMRGGLNPWNELNPSTFNWSVCSQLWKWPFMHMSVMGTVGCMSLLLDFATFPVVWYFLFH